MLLEPVWQLCQKSLFDFPHKPGLFNPYRDFAPEYDVPDAVHIRQENLKQYLAAYQQMPDVLLLAEAPGPWGCRFSGVPITSESQLLDPDFPLAGRQSSNRDKPHAEYSANIYWRLLAPWFPRFFTWNTVPFHPWKMDNPLSIRTPGKKEVALFIPVLEQLLEILQPTCVLAVGRKAEYILGCTNTPCTYVRHPSQGGAKLFAEGVRAAFEKLDIPLTR